MFNKRKLTPVKYSEVCTALVSLGFSLKSKTATSHEKWIGYRNERKYVVTVDKHEQPFSIFLIQSMARQSGVDKRIFHALCKGDITAESISTFVVTQQP